MRLRIVGLVVGVVLGTLVPLLPTSAQQPAKVPRIGWLSHGSPPSSPAFWKGMRELGYLEGQNIAVEYRWGEGKLDRLPDLATELVRVNVDAIFAWGYPAALAAKQATTKIPVVFSAHVDPVATGLVSSLARPGGNLTGVTLMAPELAGKRLELLKEAVPRASRVAVLMNTANPGFEPTLKEMEISAQALGMKLQIVEARAPGEFAGAFSAMVKGHAVGLHVSLDPLFTVHRTRLVELAAEHRLPAIYDLREFVDVGGLISYGPNLVESWQRAAAYVDRILKGAKPADLPVEQPTRFELVINLKTAKALGLTIPQSILIRADQVIQ